MFLAFMSSCWLVALEKYLGDLISLIVIIKYFNGEL